ncbi:MAG: hypothetical protein EXR91_01270 [Gemmatimonadetes bacterium]|nr:hypothetical protein [Gemmatimonadota bacterium]
MSARAFVLSVMLAASAAPLHAQSLFNAAGIGLPVEATDGRARALGSIGLGLPGASLLPTDPAASVRLMIPGALLVVQPTWVDLTRTGTGGHRYFRGSRFPLFAAGYPVFGGMATLHATTVLDQGYRGERPLTVDLAGTPVPATDVFTQAGSVASVSVGYARMITPTTSVGITTGRYTGSVASTLVREFSDSASANQVLPYASSGSWTYSGYHVSVGVSSDVAGLVRVAASATVSTDLDATAASQTTGTDRSFQMPLQLRIGASSELAQGLTLSASAARADWSGITADLSAGAQAGPATSLGVGLELSQVRLLGRTSPLRVGFRRTGLPYSLEGDGAHEQAFAGGLSLALNETNEIVLAGVDFALEKGNRTGGTYREDFWRATVSLRVSGF